MMRRRILLVDDEVGLTRALALYLVDNGNCEVKIENNAIQVLEVARDFRPDLIFLDVMMPEIDGGALAAEIQNDQVLHGTPIVFLTALVSRTEIGKAPTQIGSYPFLAKPVDPSIVLQCVDRFARQRD